MSRRSIIVGLVAALLVCGYSYFNTAVIRATSLTGGMAPIAVLGGLIVGRLWINPLLARFGPGWSLRPIELRVMAGLVLVVCVWPTPNLMRSLITSLAMPAHWHHNQAAWQASEVMAHVPGASNRVGEGFVRDFDAIAARLTADSIADPVVASLARLARPDEMQHWSATPVGTDPQARRALLRTLNAAIEDPDFFRAADPQSLPTALGSLLSQLNQLPASAAAGQEQRRIWTTQRLNRLLLCEALSPHLLPPPQGRDVLPLHGRSEPMLTQPLLTGEPLGDGEGWLGVPWSAWGGSLLQWTLLAAAAGLGLLCMGLILHTQWSRRELIAFPIARFILDMERRGDASELRTVSTRLPKPFWVGFGFAAAVAFINGLATWWPVFPFSFARSFNLTPLMDLFPNASRAPGGAWMLWIPTFFPIVVGLACLVRSDVSLSVGLAGFAWVALSGSLLGAGIAMGFEDMIYPLGLGGYLAMFGIILFTGRAYYLQVARASIGFGGPTCAAERRAAWAGRGLLTCVAVAVFILWRMGLSIGLAAGLIFICAVMHVVLARVVCESGMLLVNPGWTLLSGLTMLLGFGAIGPTAFIVAALASVVLETGLMLALPHILHALELSKPNTADTPPRQGRWLATTTVLGLGVALVSTLAIQYGRGADTADTWAMQSMPTFWFDHAAQGIGNLAATGQLGASIQSEGLERWSLVAPNRKALSWLAVGALLVGICAVARLRASWWPIHPILFLVWTSYPAYLLGPSFLLGWAIKVSVVRMGGVPAFARLRPFMIGLIAGEMLAALAWCLVGAAFYMITDKIPVAFTVLPG